MAAINKFEGFDKILLFSSRFYLQSTCVIIIGKRERRGGCGSGKNLANS